MHVHTPAASYAAILLQIKGEDNHLFSIHVYGERNVVRERHSPPQTLLNNFRWWGTQSANFIRPTEPTNENNVVSTNLEMTGK